MVMISTRNRFCGLLLLMARRLTQTGRTGRGRVTPPLQATNVFVRIRGDIGFLDRRLAKNLLNDIAKTLGYRVLGHVDHAFKPHGVTAVLLLSESHVSLHTWPEHRQAIVEMVTCTSFTKRDRERLLTTLKRHLPAATFRVILNA